MRKTELEDLVHFAQVNGMINWPFEVVLNEYLTTKDLVDNIC